MAPFSPPERNRVKVSNFFILLGPSGSGKTETIKSLLTLYPERLTFPLTYTSRPARAGEVDGKDMYFISRDEWNAMWSKGLFLASTQYGGHSYGTTADQIIRPLNEGKKIVCAFDPHGLRDSVEMGFGPISIFLKPESQAQLGAFLARRWPNDPEKINERLALYEQEMQVAQFCDYVVPSTTIPEMTQRVKDIMCLQ